MAQIALPGVLEGAMENWAGCQLLQSKLLFDPKKVLCGTNVRYLRGSRARKWRTNGSATCNDGLVGHCGLMKDVPRGGL